MALSAPTIALINETQREHGHGPIGVCSYATEVMPCGMQ
jgi:hypothetical protein